MKTLVVCGSVFGNTEQIAQAISNFLGSKEHVEALRVNDVKIEKITELDLLIIGSPTREFRSTKAITNFLKRISTNGLKGVKIAVFDTRFSLSDMEHQQRTAFVAWEMGKAAGFPNERSEKLS